MRFSWPKSRTQRLVIAAAVALSLIFWTSRIWYTGQRRAAALQTVKDVRGRLLFTQRPDLLLRVADFVGINEDSLPATLVEINLWQSSVRDSDLAVLGAIPETFSVDLSETAITDEGLVHITRLPCLHSLNLRRTRVTDAGLQHLLECEELTWLDLTGTDVSDHGLQTLATIPNLQYVNLFHTRTTLEEVESFRAEHANIQWRR